MPRILQKHLRILAIAPSTRGLGFAVLEGQETFVDWGVKSVKRNKNAESLKKVGKLIAHYQPRVLVLQATEHSRRSARIRALNKRIIAMAATHKVRVKLFLREKVMRVFFADAPGTKRALAEILAERFPDELGPRLPPKRRPWMSEDARMDIFDAAALALMVCRENSK